MLGENSTIGRLHLMLTMRYTSIVVLSVFVLLTYNAYAETSVDVRFVRIELPGENRILSLGEVILLSNSKNIALTARAKQSSIFNNAQAIRALDGNTSGHYFNNSVSSTQPETDPWWELDLGKNRRVEKLIIYNRSDCCQERINPARIAFYNSNRIIVWQGNIVFDADRYEFDIQTPAKMIGINLLANASFRQTTNQALPDYWDLHHAAALGIKNLYGVYGVDSGVASPVENTAVVKIANSNKNFHDVILMSARQHKKRSEGVYTFSVYARSSRAGMAMNVTSGWTVGKPKKFRLTSEWQRYQASFNLNSEDVRNLQPVLFFPDAGEYFISAPQLEYGAQATDFNDAGPDNDDSAGLVLKTQVRSIINKVGNLLPTSGLEASPYIFEYSFYTKDKYANLILRSDDYINSKAGVKCNSTDKSIGKKEMLDTGIMTVTDIVALPVAVLPVGNYECYVYKEKENTLQRRPTALLSKLPISPFEVRLNNVRRTLLVNNKPLFVTGIAVGYRRDLPIWYLENIKARGINTLFINFIPAESGNYDIRAVELLLSRIAENSLHAIVGLPLAGKKPQDWQDKLHRFLDLVTRLKNSEVVIGWYPVDEPAASAWRDEEIAYIYSQVKQRDPYRLVFMNWAYDGIPSKAGVEPRGGLYSTDMYSFDYYPFTGKKMSLEGYRDVFTRVQGTAQARNKIAHSWIQIFGGNDAWREPTPAELRYMVYLNLVYGSMFSYWDTKSNSSEVWDEISRLNMEAGNIAHDLLFNPESRRLALSTTDAGVAYSIWLVGNRLLVIVANSLATNQKVTIDLSSYIAGYQFPKMAHIYPDNRRVDIIDGIYMDEIPKDTGQYLTIELLD